jgi:putative transposase
MPNHFHILLRQKREGGISLFLKKLGGGYTMYVNEKYERSGHVFQGKYKSKPIKSDAYFLHLSRYIHLNPTELIDSLSNADLNTDKHKLIKSYLSQYRWSSYVDWTGEKNFPSVIDVQLVKQMRQMDGSDYSKFVIDSRRSDLGGWRPRRLDLGGWISEYRGG